MSLYGWRAHRFDPDPSWVDQTTLTFLGPLADGAPRFSLTVVREASGGTVKAYVDGVLRELVSAMPGFRLLERDDNARLDGRPATTLMTSALSPDLGPLTQYQGFGDGGDGAVVVVTATAPVAFEADAKVAFTRLWTSWRAAPST